MSTSALLCAKSAPERSRSAMAPLCAGNAVAAYLVIVTSMFVTFPLLSPRDTRVRAPWYFRRPRCPRLPGQQESVRTDNRELSRLLRPSLTQTTPVAWTFPP